ncbi:restriction endonuclease subunit S [Fredinandcohnia salidurans]|uniref:Restriction endonuclease subunit S n=1 Tax=Fredinandcohnia salidurans TaxID=2595041 RepID=A0ABW4MWQ8_9BACI
MFPVVQLGKIANFTNGGAWSQEEYSSTGIPVVRVSDISNGRIDLSQCKYLPLTSLEKYRKHLLFKDDLIIATVGSHKTQQSSVVGKHAIVTVSEENALLNQNAVKITPTDENILDKKYLRFVGSSHYFKNFIAEHARGSANQARIAISELKKMKIPLPSINIQRSIGEVLSTLEEKIMLNQQMNKTLELIAKTLYKEWFVDFGPFRDNDFEESKLGFIPKGWRIGCIGDIAKVKNGFAFKSSMWQKNGVPVIKIGNITPPFVNINGVDFVSEDIAAKTSDFLLDAGDLLIGMTGAYIGKTAILPKFTQKSLLNQRVGKFVSNIEGLNTIPLVYLLSTMESFKEQIRFKATGSAQPNISGKGVESIECLIPTENVLSEFIRIIEPIYYSMIKHQNEIIQLNQTRDFLLPRLLSGEIELKDKIFEEVL